MARGLLANWSSLLREGSYCWHLFERNWNLVGFGAGSIAGRHRDDLRGANARQAMIDIFRKKDPTAVDRYFGESFIQHDPNLADGLAGMKSCAAEVASSPTADIPIYRMLVD